jgi:hypothetical protein
MHLKTIYRHDGWLCTSYEKSALYDGTEGELYNLTEDPEQRTNLWDSETTVRDQLVEQLYAELPSPRSPQLERKAPV